MINDIQKDILTEQVNIFVGKAASYLSEMIEKKINLSIPNVYLIGPDQEDADLKQNKFQGHVMSSGISFGETISGKAQLIFPTSKVKKLVALCMGEEFYDSSDEEPEFLDNDLDVIKEIGNIILNSVIGGFSNFLGIKVSYDIPEIDIIEAKDIKVKKEDQYVLLIMDLQFNVAETDIDGMIMCYLNLDSINALIEKIEQLKDELYGIT